MGQKLEKLSEKDEESFDNSDWSGQTGETEQSEAAEQDESRDQDDGSFATPRGIGGISGISVSRPATGHAGEITVASARTDPQTGQPIRPLGRREHVLNTRGERVGGDRENRSVTRTVEESKTVPNPKETRQTSNKKQGSESKPVAFGRTTAMEELGNGKKSELGGGKVGADAQTRSLTASCDPANEEDFVVLERDETWMSSDRENNTAFGSRIETENLQSSTKRRVSHSDDKLPQLSGNGPQERGIEKTSRRKSEIVEARATSSPAACFEREMGQHLPKVTGSRCRLKGVSRVEAGHAETTGRAKAEREQNVNDHGKGQVSTHFNNEQLPTQNHSSEKRRLKIIDNLENLLDEAVQEEPGGERESNWEPGLEKVDPSLKESENQDKESRISGFVAQKQVEADQSHQSRFAGAVSRRAKAADSQPPKSKPHSSATPPRRDSFSLEQCELIPSPLPGNEGDNVKIQVACLKRESELVSFSAVITPPPITHLLPERDTSMATQQGSSMADSQMTPDTTPASCELKDESMQKPKAKGPPPPVPKKPKNPFIKLKTAQLKSADVQRRGKDHLRSEETVKRRHTFHFNKDPPFNPPINQDMCVLWDERGTYTLPTNRRPLSVDLSPWEHLSLGHMDDRYGNMINFNYCERMEKLSPEEEQQNLDMLQRNVFLERRSRFKSSPPPVAKKPQTPSASTETLHIPEVTSDNEIHRPKPAPRRREIRPEFLSERGGTQAKDRTVYRADGDAGSGSEVESYKPVSEIIKERNQVQRHQGHRVKPEGPKAQVRVAEQSPSVTVSQMKSAFDVPKKPKERPPEPQPSPKKGKDFGLSLLEPSLLSLTQ